MNEPLRNFRPDGGDPDMQTPYTGAGLRVYDDLPADVATARAWTEPGANPGWHRAARLKVTGAMPVLARALDRLTGTVHPDTRAAAALDELTALRAYLTDHGMGYAKINVRLDRIEALLKGDAR